MADGKWQKDWSTEGEAEIFLNKLGITEHDVPVEQLSWWTEEACSSGQNSGKALLMC